MEEQRHARTGGQPLEFDSENNRKVAQGSAAYREMIKKIKEKS